MESSSATNDTRQSAAPWRSSIPFQVKVRQIAPFAVKGDLAQNHMSEKSASR